MRKEDQNDEWKMKKRRKREVANLKKKNLPSREKRESFTPLLTRTMCYDSDRVK